MGPPGTAAYVENVAALQWALGNHAALIGIDDANGTASWAQERTSAAREFLINAPITANTATKVVCGVLGATHAQKFKAPELASYTSALGAWALSPAEDIAQGIDLVTSHKHIPAKTRWNSVMAMTASGFFRLSLLMPAMLKEPQFSEWHADIWEILYSCLHKFEVVFPAIHEIATPIPGAMPPRDPNRPIRVAAWSHKFGGFLSSATTVHPWLMNLPEPGLEIYLLSERRTGDPVQQRYREIYGDRFIDCDEMSDDAFVAKARSLDLDVLIMVHLVRNVSVQMQRMARCHFDYHGMHRPYAVPDQTLINLGALDLDFAKSTGRKMISIPDPPFVHTPRPHVELKDRKPGDTFCFGAFNRALKFNSELLDVWARILRECPNSSLMVAFLQVDFFSELVIKGEMSRRGVQPSRVKVLPPAPHAQHLERHNEIDVMLDVFPVGAGMTAIDTFDMGVPLISRAGDYRPCALQTKSVIAMVGPEAGLYAGDTESYVAYAKARYAEGPRSKARRQALRDALNKTPIYNDQRYTRFMRQALRICADPDAAQITYINE